jgi:hypothetical protein
MDQDLQRLARELRNEKCPQRVIDEVTRRISLQPRQRGLGSFKIASVTALLALLCGLAIWRRPPVGEAPHLQQVARANVARAQVAAEAQDALGYIGVVLRDAGAQTRKIVLNQAVPPLRNSLATARNKLLNHIEP